MKESEAWLSQAVAAENGQAAVPDSAGTALALRVSEARFRSLYEHAPIGVVLLDIRGRYLVANKTAQAILGYNENELRHKTFSECTDPRDVACGWELFQQVVSGARDAYTMDKRYVRNDGRIVWTQVAVSATRDERGGVMSIIGMMLDVTDRHDAEELLRGRARQQAAVASLGLRAMAASKPQEVFDIAVRLIVETLAVEYCSIVEYRRDDDTLVSRAAVGWDAGEAWNAPVAALGNTHASMTLLKGAPVIIDDLRELPDQAKLPHLSARGVVSGVSVVIHGPHCSFGAVTAHTTHKHHFGEEDVHFLQGIAQMLSLTIERDLSARALRWQAVHDPLTDLPNRTYLMNRLQDELVASRDRTGPPAVLLLDINRFKKIIDTLGYTHSDLLLQQLARQLRNLVPADATVASLGGDEFAIVLPSSDLPSAVAQARIIQEALLNPFVIQGQVLDVEASIGIALAAGSEMDAPALLRQAAVAKYAAQRANDEFVVYTAKHDTYNPDHLSLLGDLRRGITHGQLRLFYQPQISVTTRRLSGVEALVRWEHPIRGLVMPDEFIPLAEGTGAIKPLTHWVLEAALQQCSVWRRLGLNIRVAVNLSARNLHDVALLPSIRDLLIAYQVPPNYLTLEITESAVMDDPARALIMLTRLNAMGVRLEIDDFGTGYSSLSYLKRLPVDGLKVDRSFVQHLADDPNDAAIVASTIGLAHSLGLHVVAEGVETAEVLERLGTLKCDVAQGYYLSKPVPAPDLEQWHATWQQRSQRAANSAAELSFGRT